MNWFKSPQNHTNECYGVDPNKNFDYNWMKKATSSEECSDFYGGPHAFSEPETKLVSNFLKNSKRKIDMLIALNGYGQKISFPSGGMSQEPVDNLYDLARAGLKNVQSQKSNIAKYTIDSRRKLAGTMEQFAMHKLNIKYSYTIESRDDETHGFFVPATSIEENAKEIFQIIFGMVQDLY